jgi:hypothetical protein
MAGFCQTNDTRFWDGKAESIGCLLMVPGFHRLRVTFPLHLHRASRLALTSAIPGCVGLQVQNTSQSGLPQSWLTGTFRLATDLLIMKPCSVVTWHHAPPQLCCLRTTFVEAVMIDAGQIIYLARNVKVGLGALAAIIFLLTIYTISLFFGRDGYADYVLVGATLLNTMVVLIFGGVVVMFGQRDSNIDDLKKRTDDFLKRVVRSSLETIAISDVGIFGMECTVSSRKENIGYVFHLKTSNSSLQEGAPLVQAKVWIGLNVHRFLIIYYLDATAYQPDIFVEHAKDVFSFTLAGAHSVGYKEVFQPAVVAGENICSVWLVANADKDLLTDPRSKLFWAQDIAMMTESFLRSAYRSGISFFPKSDPGPL